MSRKASAEIVVAMAVDVDGAPNAYGPRGKPTLDDERNAHVHADPKKRVVGYLTEKDGRTPILQTASDPYPGYYISTAGYEDKNNPNSTDPRRYLNAAEINYTLLASVAQRASVALGDFCTVHSLKTQRTVYAIVGDTGNSRGTEGSLALLQRLGYDVKDGRSSPVVNKEVVVRYFAQTNPGKLFFLHQSELESRAASMNLDTDFSNYHSGSDGQLVFDRVAAAPATGITSSRRSRTGRFRRTRRATRGH